MATCSRKDMVINMGENRETVKIVVVGHVDHGKSTVIGRLLYDTNSLPEGAIDRVKRISKEKGKPFEYAYLLDAFEEEQKQGITIDTTQLQFFTEKRDYVIIDAPGHKEFLKNMISGAASAEAALLVIDANEGIKEQSKRHGYILSLLGIQKVYVIVNKMDLLEYSEEKFIQIKKEFNEFLQSLQVTPLDYIPISAFYGENIAKKSEEMPWYNGKPILEAIDEIPKDKELSGKPLRFPIQDVYKFDARRIIVGRVEAGTLKEGDEIQIAPGNKTTRVKTVEFWADKDTATVVSAGQSVGITVEDEFFNKRGEIISHNESVPVVSNRFRANVFWMGKNDLVTKKKYKIKLATAEVEAEIKTILKVIDASTLSGEEKPQRVKINDVAEIIVETKEPVAFDEFKDSKATGRFVIVDGYDVAGGGIISRAEEAVLTKGFLKEGLFLNSKIFEEYYYSVLDNSIKNVQTNLNIYHVGDVIPTSGATFKYPDSFDIIGISDGIVVLIRDKVVKDILRLSEYSYSYLPLVNARGFGIKVSSQEEYKQLIEERGGTDEKELAKDVNFSNQWFSLNQYKTIHFNEDSVYEIEYNI
jgi:bifunctional enzyme CysN/CysC/sulfate adenylyltransferase subunit 1